MSDLKKTAKTDVQKWLKQIIENRPKIKANIRPIALVV